MNPKSCVFRFDRGVTLIRSSSASRSRESQRPRGPNLQLGCSATEERRDVDSDCLSFLFVHVPLVQKEKLIFLLNRYLLVIARQIISNEHSNCSFISVTTRLVCLQQNVRNTKSFLWNSNSNLRQPETLRAVECRRPSGRQRWK